ncbi:ABC transporter substrate-binding protein [Brevibacillus borstelensis]|uniref:ABC transporter substrate-binding protein n=1 Tax=Brevibacillus borstelensis TaxID=45462 RepID=UPI0030C4CC37
MEYAPVHTQLVHNILNDLWLKLQSAELIRADRMEQQLIESHVLFVAKNGEGRLTIDYRDYRLRRDAVHFAHPGQTIGVFAESEQGVELYAVRFAVQDDAKTAAGFPLKGEVPIYPETQAFMLCDLISACLCSDHSLERFRGQSAFLELMYVLLKNIRLLPERDPRTALDRTKAYIETHYKENLTIEQLARMADISPKYFVDLFKKTYGKSCIDYLTEVRINNAKRLMTRSDIRVRDLAHQVGYSDEFYFSRKFKKEVGVSPSVYMKNRRRKIVAYTPAILGQLLALQIMPYAAPLHPKWTHYYYRRYRADIPLHLSAYRFNRDWESNMEALVRARPDIIVCDKDSLHMSEREELEKIAQVFFIPGKGLHWREQLKLTARLLEAEHKAECWLHSYDQKIKSVRDHLNRELKDDKILAMSIYKNHYYVSPVRGMMDVLCHDLRLNVVPGLLPGEARQAISAEQLADLDADRIMLNICQEPESLREWQSLQSSAFWRDLKAVRRNRVHLISSDPWREYSAYACERMVDDFLKQLHGDRPDEFRI